MHLSLSVVAIVALGAPALALRGTPSRIPLVHAEPDLVNPAGDAAALSSNGLYVSPAATAVTPGTALTIEVRANLVGDPANAVEIDLLFPPTLAYVNATVNAATWGVTAGEISASNGVLNIQVGSQTPVSGDQLVATVTFNVLGAAKVSLSGASAIYSATTSTPEPITNGGGTYTSTSSPNGEFTALTPTRVFDQRPALGTGGRTDVQIAGAGGVPLSGASAVVMNVTVTNATGSSYLTVWPTGISRPLISNLNYVPGQTVPNLVTVAVGAGGKVSFYNNVGSVGLVVDVVGFYADATGPSGSRFRGLDPARLFDTRIGSGGVPTSPVGQGKTLPLQVLGQGGVPATGVTAVVMNVTVTNPTASSYVTVYPDDVSRPLASNLNFTNGQTVPNLVVVRVPPSGFVDFYNNAGSADLLADVVGYYDGNQTTNAGRFIGLSPTRLLDTRNPPPAPLKAGERRALQIAGTGGVPPAGAGAVVLNVTVTEPTAPGFLTVVPSDACSVPVASNLNFVPGQTVPNLVMIRLSSSGGCAGAAGRDDFYNLTGKTHLVVDIFGYFSDAT